MDTEEYRKKIEEEILQIIEEKLKERKIDANRAKEIARYVLESLHPHMDINQIHGTVQKFDDNFSELTPIVLQVSQDYDERIKKAVSDHVGNLVKQNKIGEASDLLKKALNKEVHLSK